MSRQTGKFLTNYTFFLFWKPRKHPLPKKDCFPCTVCEATTFLAIDKPSRHQELSTTINLSTCDHVIQSWRNWFNFNWWNTGYCNDPTTARHRAMDLLYNFYGGGKLRRWQIDHVTSRAKTEGWEFFELNLFILLKTMQKIGNGCSESSTLLYILLTITSSIPEISVQWIH